MKRDNATGIDPPTEEADARGDFLETVTHGSNNACKECGVWFQSRHGNQKYCSSRCAANARLKAMHIPKAEQFRQGPKRPHSLTGRILELIDGMKAGEVVYLVTQPKQVTSYKNMKLITRKIRVSTVLVTDNYLSKRPTTTKITKVECIS